MINNDESAIRAISLEYGNQGRLAYDLILKGGETTSADVSSCLGISVQHASVLLARIYRQNYVGRYERIAATGGSEWVYYL